MISAYDPLAEVLSVLADRASDAKDRVSELRQLVTRELDLRPVRTLALTAGAGYLLAGGLFSRLTVRLISFGARLAILPVIAAGLAAAREESENSEDSDTASTHPAKPRRSRSRHDLTEPQT
jgi:hypothetical protein